MRKLTSSLLLTILGTLPAVAAAPAPAALLSTQPDWVTEGNVANGIYGNVVIPAGDVNGDGYADFTTSSFRWDNPEVDEGKVFLFLGSPTGPSLTPDWTFEANQAVALFGGSPAGDVNGDGYDDLACSSSFYDGGQIDEGRVWIFKGSAHGLRTRPLVILEIDEASAGFGTARAAGDINGDGYGDIMTTAQALAGNLDQRVFIYLGSRKGPSRTADTLLRADQPNANFGVSYGSGDFNGDGFTDVIIGARFYDVTLTSQGRAFVFVGSASGLVTTPAWTFDGEQAAEELGVGVAGAGDVNGDGFDDALVGAHAFDNPEVNEGRALLFFGSP